MRRNALSCLIRSNSRHISINRSMRSDGSSSRIFFSSSSSSSTPPTTPTPLSPLSLSVATPLPNVSPIFRSAAVNDPNIPTPATGIPVAVKAYFVARGIDIVRLHSQVYSSNRQEFQAKAVTVTLDSSLNQYVSIFKYGSVVFFNVPESQHLEHLTKIRSAAVVTPIDEGLQHTEDYKIYIHNELQQPSVIKATHTNIRTLDSFNITIIGTVMAQTVALDYYAVAVDRMLETFILMNKKIENSGSFQSLDNSGLYKLIASNNTVFTNVLSKLGIFEGSDAAWENADYHYTWEGLRKDFELDYRFKDLSLKVDIVKDNTRFFLEVLQNNKSTKLEWIIIILIAAELTIGCIGLVPKSIIG